MSVSNLLKAWKEFKRCKNSKKDVWEFEFSLENNLFSLHKELLSKTYKPDAYESFYVCDPKRRHIHKATVRDRVLHQAIFRVLYPIFDKHFVHDSYSSRINKGTHKGAKRLFEFLRKESSNWKFTAFALKCDIRKFFDSINHDILFSLIKQKVNCNETLWLINIVLKSFEKSPKFGLPLGNVTSQLFSNIYLNELDQFIKHKLNVKYYVRYADDFILINKSKQILENHLLEIKSFLLKNLKLEIHPNKVIFSKSTQGVDFVGYVVLPKMVVLRTKTKNRILKKLSIMKAKLLKKEIDIDKFNQIKISYLGILKHCKNKVIEKQINRI